MAEDSTSFVSKTDQIRHSDGYQGTLTENKATRSDTFVEFYLRHVNKVYRHVLVRTGNTQVAQDLTSEVFLAALKNFERFRGESSFATWVLGIAQHKITDYYRAQRNHLPLDSIASVASAAPSVERIAEQQWQLHQVTQALRLLTPDRANALALHIFAELSIEETSQILEKSSSAVKMLIYRGIRDLKVLLDAEMKE